MISGSLERTGLSECIPVRCRPYLHFQATFAKNGSPSRTSIAQNGTGIRTQLRPAAAISAKSFSVCKQEAVNYDATWHMTKFTYDECVIVMLQYFRQILAKIDTQGPFVSCRLWGFQMWLEDRRCDEWLEIEPAIAQRRFSIRSQQKVSSEHAHPPMLTPYIRSLE